MEVEGEVVRGVVRNNGEYLMLRRSETNSSSGKWAAPGGKIEEEESVEKAVKREIREETGLEAEIVRKGDSYIDEGELGYWKIFPVLLETGSREVQMNHEHDMYEWVELSEIEDFDTLGEVDDLEQLQIAQ